MWPSSAAFRGPVVVPALGIYVASAIFILVFMLVVGRENPLKAIMVCGCSCRPHLFFMFERWFLVPLPKGPLEPSSATDKQAAYLNSSTPSRIVRTRANSSSCARGLILMYSSHAVRWASCSQAA